MDESVVNGPPSPDLQISQGGEVVMEYPDLCDKCQAVVASGLERLGKIERGNRKPRKKADPEKKADKKNGGKGKKK